MPPFALSEPAKLMPAPDDLSITLPAVAVIDEAAAELRAPLASASKLPVAVVFDPVKVRAPVLLRNTPLEAFAVTLATDETSTRAPVPVPIEPPVEVKLS